MHAWLQQIVDSQPVAGLVEALKSRARVGCECAVGSSAHLIVGAVQLCSRRPVLLVVAHLDDADEAIDDLALFDDSLDVMGFPALEVMPGDGNVSLELLSDRLAVVSRLIAGDCPHIVVAPIHALMQPVPKSEAIGSVILDLKPGTEIGQGGLVDWLSSAGYRRVDGLEEPGDFTVRGGIVDVFPPGADAPVRLDFFGDEVEEITAVDLQTLRSDRKLKHLRLIGATAEALLSSAQTTALTSLLAPEMIVVLHETLEIDEQARGYYERLNDPRGIITPRAVHEQLSKFPVIELNQFATASIGEQPQRLPIASLMNFDSDATKAVGELAELSRASRTIVLCQRDAEAERLRELIRDQAPGAKVEVETGYLYRGFVWEHPSAITLVPYHELLHRYRARRRIRRVGVTASTEGFFDIEPGDYVVHQHHGVAIFRGLKMMLKGRDVGGADAEEFLTLEFAGKALLHVPASQIDLVQRYVGGFSGRPPLSKLGGTRWTKQKEQAQEAAKQLAAELLRIQAARAAMPGIRYPDDTPWVKRFEAEFPYEETDDQLAAMVEIKKDMSDAQPMDRLVCGDVGYGKTELAMRAAFKAVESGKQVAVLCPTTVLCEQHGRTFRERMADYPIRIAVLNRLKSAADTKAALDGLRDGTVDIAIGTHRLLSSDIGFADLGMVVVDEEQKFGVEHKSRLMRFRLTVDVLTLSATPIPRTLHMALLGLRDISSLSTPPADRRAVVTEVVPYEPKRIRRAILRELNREGQCFFVHNRVQSIHAVAAELQTLVPEARIVVGHGQMPGSELEDVMLRFVNREADVLVCTTIIESGIDIPTANTMFIADCDRFGLAELHQLRGRVGRYKHRAYCYMLLPQSRPLSEVAMRRLRAIEEYAMLGAGFRIAMRDMEIRGVGNLLGAEQSGHIAAVGYELYCRLLEEASSRLSDQPTRHPSDTHIEIKIAGHLPRSYILSDRHRMEAYRRIARCPDHGALKEVELGLVDAYGPLPEPAGVLIDLAEIRIALAAAGVKSLKREGPDLVFTTHDIRSVSAKLEKAKGVVRLVDPPTRDRPGTVYYRPPGSQIGHRKAMLSLLRHLLLS